MFEPSQVNSIAGTLLRARQSNAPITDLAPGEIPASIEDAYPIQDAIAKEFGAIGGFKVGATSPTDKPFFCPMPLTWMAPTGAALDAPRHRLRGVEAEIAFRIGKDLPPRDLAYTREELIDAIGGCAPAIEVLESGLVHPLKAQRMSMIADIQMHGGFVFGNDVPNWQSIDWAQESVVLSLNNKVEMERTASNVAGTDLLRLVLFLANEGAARIGGLRKGQWITTGSWTGATWTDAATHVVAKFSTAGTVELHFA